MMLEFLSGGIQMKHKDANQNKSKFPKSFMMSFKGHEEMAIITSIINAHIYFEILDDLLIPSINDPVGWVAEYID